MKYIISFFYFSMCLQIITFAQNESNWSTPLQPPATRILLDVVTDNGKLAITHHQYQGTANKFITFDSLRLNDADIYLPLNIQLPKDADRFIINIELLNQQKQLIARKTTDFNTSGKHEIILYDITERGLYLNESYTLNIYHDLVGSIPCEAVRPVFDWQEKKWPVFTTSLGLIGLGISEIGLKFKQKSDYDRYIDKWASGASEADAKPDIDDAVKTKDLRRVVTWGSSALAIGGTIWYLAKRRNIRRRQTHFDRYCSSKPALTISPELSYHSKNESIAFKLTYQF